MTNHEETAKPAGVDDMLDNVYERLGHYADQLDTLADCLEAPNVVPSSIGGGVRANAGYLRRTMEHITLSRELDRIAPQSAPGLDKNLACKRQNETREEMTTISSDLAALIELEGKSQPGPWEYLDCALINMKTRDSHILEGRMYDDQMFIAAAKNFISTYGLELQAIVAPIQDKHGPGNTNG